MARETEKGRGNLRIRLELNTSAKAQLCLLEIFFTHSTHVETVTFLVRKD